jgi:hypothetical protein
LRANLEINVRSYRRFVFSLIHRTLDFEGEDDATRTPFSVKSESQTAGVYGYWKVKSRYWTGAMLALENLDVSAAGHSPNRKELIPKVGAMVSLSF